MSPKESLAIVQELYEGGYVSYPRTNTEYLATAECAKINSILQKLCAKGYHVCAKDGNTGIYDDSKIESHSALTPTGKLPSEGDLKENAWKVYSTIIGLEAQQQAVREIQVLMKDITNINHFLSNSN